MAKVKDLNAMLKRFDSQAKAIAPAEGSGGTKFPDGTYQFEVQAPSSGIMVAEDNDGAVRARVVLECVQAPDEGLVGKKATKSWTMVDKDGNLSEMGVSICKGDLKTLGQDGIQGTSEIPGALEAVLGTVVQAKVAHKTDANGIERENIYFNTLVKEAGTGKPAARPAAPAAPKAGASKRKF